jgi:(R)-2-hydroxyacyl-CoA dehydratese activating ATPase
MASRTPVAARRSIMTCTAGIDVGSTYTKAVSSWRPADRRAGARADRLPLDARSRRRTLARRGSRRASPERRRYMVTTGFGRHQVPFSDVQVTDLTAAARGAAPVPRHAHHPRRRRPDHEGDAARRARKVKSFRLNDKCAAGTGAFLEKTARYMGYATDEIGPLVATSKTPCPSPACAPSSPSPRSSTSCRRAPRPPTSCTAPSSRSSAARSSS